MPVPKACLTHSPLVIQGPDPPTEPTSTLVLTSSQSYFVDIRFSLVGPKATSPPEYWAFAGVSRSTFQSSPDAAPSTSSSASPPPAKDAPPVRFPCSIHTTWTRFLDSRGDVTSPDQGTTYLLHNGDCVELGHMTNPKTGRSQFYQELWTSPSEDDDGPDPDPKPHVSSSIKSNQPPPSRPKPALKKSKAVVVVALLHRPPGLSTPPKGIIIRIGSYCQGIVAIPASTTLTAHNNNNNNNNLPHSHDPNSRDDGIVRVERWRLDRNLTQQGDGPDPSLAAAAAAGVQEAGEQEQGVWVRDPRSDYEEDARLGVWMPCLWVCGARNEGRRVVGDWMEKDGFEARWRVVEVEGW